MIFRSRRQKKFFDSSSFPPQAPESAYDGPLITEKDFEDKEFWAKFVRAVNRNANAAFRKTEEAFTDHMKSDAHVAVISNRLLHSPATMITLRRRFWPLSGQLGKMIFANPKKSFTGECSKTDVWLNVTLDSGGNCGLHS
ncbi:hypothetical protein VTJ04DRAFT_5416 [Mycothermus thermophilus]|uniref:uncharacterized protein n=1 Tax=Humicola insolens TaxID=85995 RepID=UPI0037442234